MKSGHLLIDKECVGNPDELDVLSPDNKLLDTKLLNQICYNCIENYTNITSTKYKKVLLKYV